MSYSQIIKDPNNLRITTKLNGQKVQDSTTKDMIFNVKKIINFISQGTTLLPGDVIMTGTPQGTHIPPLSAATAASDLLQLLLTLHLSCRCSLALAPTPTYCSDSRHFYPAPLILPLTAVMWLF
jgi:Fumarylacetoacetate (FAA) hydrolase family